MWLRLVTNSFTYISQVVNDCVRIVSFDDFTMDASLCGNKSLSKDEYLLSLLANWRCEKKERAKEKIAMSLLNDMTEYDNRGRSLKRVRAISLESISTGFSSFPWTKIYAAGIDWLISSLLPRNISSLVSLAFSRCSKSTVFWFSSSPRHVWKKQRRRKNRLLQSGDIRWWYHNASFRIVDQLNSWLKISQPSTHR